MTAKQLLEAIGEIDDSYIERYTRGYHKPLRAHWGLISAAACFCLMVTSVIFVLSSGLIPAFPTADSAKLHSAWQYVYPQSGALSENGYYHMESGNRLWYADLNTGENSILCSIPDCDHTGTKCNAYLQADTKGIVCHNEYLYYYGTHDGTFHRRNADGTGDIRYDDPLCVVDTNDFAVSGQYLYYSGWAGGDTPDQTEYRVARMHLVSGKSEILWRQEVPRDNINRKVMLLAVQDTGVMFLWSEGTETAFEAETVPMHVAYWDGAAGESRELLQKPGSQLQQVYLVADGKLYFSEKNGVGQKPNTKVYDLVTGRETTAFKNAGMTALGGGYAVLHKAEDDWSVIRLPDGSQLPGEMIRPVLCAVNADGLVLYRKLSGEAAENAHFYLPYTAMADGIQESDLVKLYASALGYEDSQ